MDPPEKSLTKMQSPFTRTAPKWRNVLTDEEAVVRIGKIGL